LPSISRVRQTVHALAGTHWRWVFVPVLAVLAYIPALSVGFLSDDWALLLQAEQAGIDPGVFLPNPAWPSYRPIGALLTWQLGWQIFGASPFLYHALGLLLHAATALALGLWASTVSGRAGLGWLAGALFAVFPLHLEAVGWVAAQWDIWAVLFGILSMWTFALWWRGGADWKLYLLSLLLYGLGIFSKESLLAFLPLHLLSAWLVRVPDWWRGWARLGLALVPFGALLLANVGIRLLVLGTLGGYAEARGDIGNFFWTNFAAHLRLLLSPLAELTLGGPATQLLGALVSALLLLGLIYFGKNQRHLLAAAAVWVVLGLVPVINLAPSALDLQQNRLLYLASAGYCVFAAALIYAALLAAGKLKPAALTAIAIALFLGIVASWAQMRPWQTATAQTEDIASTLSALIPARQGRSIDLYVENRPDNQRGAYVFRIGMGAMRRFRGGDNAMMHEAASAQSTDLAWGTGDAFAVRFGYDSRARRSTVAYAAGITGDEGPPQKVEGALQLWDFRTCEPEALGAWQASGAQAECREGVGLVLTPTGSDPQLTNSMLNYPTGDTPAEFLRVRVSASYSDHPPQEGLEHISEWFWKGASGFSGDNRRFLPVREGPETWEYWTFIPINDVGPALTGLRFDPTNAQTTVRIGWIALDGVETK
jgi:hypothetical protein